MIGKVLDKIATAGKIRNVNNKMDASKNEVSNYCHSFFYTFCCISMAHFYKLYCLQRLILIDQETNSVLNVDDRLGDAIESGGGVLLEREGVINQ